MPSNNGAARKAQRRTEAAERQARWDAMSEDERFAAHRSRGERYISKVAK